MAGPSSELCSVSPGRNPASVAVARGTALPLPSPARGRDDPGGRVSNHTGAGCQGEAGMARRAKHDVSGGASTSTLVAASSALTSPEPPRSVGGMSPGVGTSPAPRQAITAWSVGMARTGSPQVNPEGAALSTEQSELASVGSGEYSPARGKTGHIRSSFGVVCSAGARRADSVPPGWGGGQGSPAKRLNGARRADPSHHDTRTERRPAGTHDRGAAEGVHDRRTVPGSRTTGGGSREGIHTEERDHVRQE